MGQNNSRLEGPETPTENNLRSDSINHNGESNSNGEEVGSTGVGATSLPRRSRRTSMRQSLRALLKPSDSTRDVTQVDSNLSNPDSQLSRRRSLWRRSRRLSKRAEDVDTRTAEEEAVAPAVSDLRGEEVDITLTRPSSKGKEREEEEQNPSELAKLADHHQAAIPSSSEPPSPIAEHQGESGTSTNIWTSLSGSGSLGLAPDEDEVMISPTTFADEAPTPEIENPETNNHNHHPWASMAEFTPSLPSLNQPSVSDAPPPLPTQNQDEDQQQFPPPGTLVIVQALVHTADIPQRRFGLFNRDRDAGSRPSPSPSPSSPTTSASTTRQATPASRSLTPIRRDSASATRSQNRLSSFISRPSGSMLSQSPSIVSNPIGAAAAPVLPSIEDVSAHSDTTPNTSGDQTPDFDRIESDTSVSEDAPASNQPLSPSSIDVLGTLLRYVP